MGSSLPLDVVIENILTRTSPETVRATRVVCKWFNEATQTWNFGEKFRSRTKTTIYGFLIEYMNFDLRREYFSMNEPPRNLSFGFLMQYMSFCRLRRKYLSLGCYPLIPFKIEAIAKQGLFLCRCEGERWNQPPSFFVYKPATQQVREIPRPKTRYSTERFVMTVLSSNPNELRYKIVRFSQPKCSFFYYKSKKYSIYRCEVFDSATWTWRLLPKDVRVPFLKCVLFKEPVVSTAGFIYALTCERKIFAFDWETETFHESASLPAPLSEGEGKLTLLDCGGKLSASFLAEPYTCMELWVSEGRGDARVWSMRSRVNVECRKACVFHYASVLAMASNDVVVLRTCSGIEFFRLGSEDLSENEVVKTLDYHNTSMVEFFCVESDEQAVDPRFLKMN